MNLREVTGAINGSNRDFSVPDPYVAGSLNVLHNGRLVAPTLDDGFDEVDPSLGTFRMRAPPVGGDVLFAFYRVT